jgi:hypothetical protein
LRSGGQHSGRLAAADDALWKAKDMRRDPRVALSVTDL